MSFTDRLRQLAGPSWDAQLIHPFVLALGNGTLPERKFKYYILQDARFLGDLSRVFVRRPSGTFVEARYSDVTLPSITLSEAKAASRALRAKGRREVDTRVLVRAAVAQRAIVAGATKRDRPGRRSGPSPANRADDDGLGSLRGVDSRTPVSSVEDQG